MDDETITVNSDDNPFLNHSNIITITMPYETRGKFTGTILERITTHATEIGFIGL